MKIITAFVKMQRRQVSSSSLFVQRHSSTATTATKIPKSTWSIKEISLHSPSSSADAAVTKNSNPNKLNSFSSSSSSSAATIISNDELYTLANRCLIDVSIMEEKERDKLKVELSNMMQCISMVTSFECTQDKGDDNDNNEVMNQEELEEYMYDIPRGFSSHVHCQLRKDDSIEYVNSWNDDHGSMQETKFIINDLKQKGNLHEYKKEHSGDHHNDHDEKAWYFAVPSIKES